MVLMPWNRVVPVATTTTTTIATSSETSTLDTFMLRHWHRRSLWGLLVTVQLLNAALLAFFASIYFARNTPNSLLWTAAVYFMSADGYEFTTRYSTCVAGGYTLLSLVFALNGLQLIWLSLRSRQFSFGACARRGPHISLVVASPRRGPMLRVRQWIEHSIFTVSVHGSCFQRRQFAAKLFALGSQTTAAYLTSRSISNPYLNLTYGLVIFANGIAIVVFATRFHQNRLQHRFACLFTDVLLDFVWGSLLPLWMLLPILEIYRTALAAAVPMNESESSAREICRVFVVSWPSFLLSLIPFASSLLGIRELQAILRDDTADAIMLEKRPTASQPRRLFRSCWTKWAHALLAAYGFIVFCISLFAVDVLGRVQRRPQYACTFRLHPWFSTKEACVMRTIDCAAVGIRGHLTEIEAALELLDENSLSDISFSSCDALTISPTLSRFSGLETILIEASWIADWSMDAALTEDKFPELKTIILLDFDTNTTLYGLVAAPISSTVEYIRFHRVPKAETILAPIGDNWQHLIFFDCDRCDLTDVPRAVNAMYRLRTLSLAENQFLMLRDDYITKWDLSMMAIWMDGVSQLTELSDVVWKQAATCDMFSMQRTNLSAIPHWVASVAHRQFVVYAFGTPLCDSAHGLLDNVPAEVRTLVACQHMDIE